MQNLIKLKTKIQIKQLLIFLTLWLTSVGISQSMWAEGMKHQKKHMMPMKKGMAQLGEAKKPMVKSKKKNFIIHVEKLPITTGEVEFMIHIENSQKQSVSKKAEVKLQLYMPGMEMDNSAVEVSPNGNGMFQIKFPLSMKGYWKLKVSIKDRGQQDKATLKFIIK